jgi:hypothetical protein
MPKVTLDCSFSFEMHVFWSKEGLGVKLGLPTTNPLKSNNQIKSDWNMQYTIGKDLFEGYKILPLDVPNMFDLKNIWMSKVSRQQKYQFWDSHLRVSGKKCHLNVALTKSHIIYYRKRNGGSSYRLRAM